MKPVLFIGLGGAGTSTVFYIKKYFADYYKNAIPSTVEFLCFDTDENDFEFLSKKVGENLLKKGEDWINLGGFNPWRTYKIIAQKNKEELSENERALLNWIDPRCANNFFDREIKDGASADRQQGRLCFWQRVREIDTAIGSKIDKITATTGTSTTSDKGEKDITFCIITGSAGGTGSSIFLDMVYKINEIYRRRNPGEPTIYAFIYLPFRYIDIARKNKSPQFLIDKLYSNSYAFFEEIEYFLKDRFIGKDPNTRGLNFQKYYALSKLTPQDFPFRPFTIGFLIDEKTDRGENILEADLYPTSAKAIFNFIITSTIDSIKTGFDNVEKALQIINPNTYEKSIPAYGSIGFSSIEYPTELIVKYLTTKFVFDVLNQIRKPFSPTEVTVAKCAEELIVKSTNPIFADYAQSDFNFEKKAIENANKYISELDTIFKNTFYDEKGKIKSINPQDLTTFIETRKFKEDEIIMSIKSIYAMEFKDKGIRHFLVEISKFINENIHHGFDYILKILERVDTNLTSRCGDIENENSKLNIEKNRMENKLEKIENEILNKKGKNLQEYKETLSNYMNLLKNIHINNAKIDYLKAVSKEEITQRDKETIPILDKLRNQIINTINIIDVNIAEINKKLTKDLPTEFDFKKSDPMTIYIPSPDSIPEQDNEINQIYQKHVKFEGESNWLKDALSSSNLDFAFSDLINASTKDEKNALMDKMLTNLFKFAKQSFDVNPEIHYTIYKSIEDIITPLPELKRKEISSNFEIQNVRTLTRYDEAYLGESNEYYAYCLYKVDLANSLGLNLEKIKNSWIEYKDPTKIIVIKLKLLFPKEAAAGMSELKHHYESRSRREILPHINKEWNDYGLQYYEHISDVKYMKLFSILLLYDYLLSYLLSKNIDLKNKLPYTERSLPVSPLFRKQTSSKEKELILCIPEKDQNTGNYKLTNQNLIVLSTSKIGKFDFNTAYLEFIKFASKYSSIFEDIITNFENTLINHETLNLLKDYIDKFSKQLNEVKDNDPQKQILDAIYETTNKYIKEIEDRIYPTRKEPSII